MKNALIILSLLFSIKTFASDIEVSNAKIKVLPATSKVTAIYLDIKNNGKEDIALKSVSGKFAEVFELHTMEMKNGMMKMMKVNEIIIKKNSTTILEAGGLHIMVFELKSPVTKEGTYEIELNFSNDLKIKTKATGINFIKEKSHSH